MSKIEITDELLYEYIHKTDEYLLNKLPKEDEIDYEFSDMFEYKMKKLIKKSKRPTFFYNINRYSKKIAVAAIAFIISIFTVTMSVDAWRIQFFDFIRDIYETFTIYQYRIKDDIYIENIEFKQPNYLPDGFNEIDRIESEGRIYISYSNEYDYITFSSFKITDRNMYVDTEDATVSKIMINEIEGDYIVKDKDYKIIWNDSENIYILTLEYINSSKLDNPKDELIKIAENIK